jgi:hypothetical protein
MPSSEHKVTLRLALRDENETVAAEITAAAVPENGLQAFVDLVLLALEQHADNACRGGGDHPDCRQDHVADQQERRSSAACDCS